MYEVAPAALLQLRTGLTGMPITLFAGDSGSGGEGTGFEIEVTTGRTLMLTDVIPDEGSATFTHLDPLNTEERFVETVPSSVRSSN